MPDNMVPIYNILRNSGYDCVTVFLPLNGNKIKKMLGFIRFMKLYAQAGFIVLTDYYPPVYTAKPRKGTSIVQLWHAAGAFKKWGYSTADASWGKSREDLENNPIHTNYTHVVVSSPDIIPHYAEAFRMDQSNIFPYGIPRTDVFFNSNFIAEGKNKLFKLFPQASGKKIILYAPTFRGTNIRESYNENKLDFETLQSKIGDGYCLITKYHPFVSKGSYTVPDAQSDFAKDVTREMDIDAALCAADILITDYSSLVFEFSLLERPMIFFAYDLESYIDERGFYYPYLDFVPGPVVKNNAEIAEAVISFEQGFDRKKVLAFKEKFMAACDGNSTTRIIENIFGKPE
jgi:CDP-ribitol ribitolphosphotransferase